MMKVSIIKKVGVIFVSVFFCILIGCNQPGNLSSGSDEPDESGPIIITLSGTDSRMLGIKILVDISEWEYDSVNKKYKYIKYVGCLWSGKQGYYEGKASRNITDMLKPGKYYSLRVITDLGSGNYLGSKLIIDDTVKELARLEKDYFIIDLKCGGTYDFSFASYDDDPPEGYNNFVFNVTRNSPSANN